MPQPKKISAYQMYDFSFMLKQNQDWIKEYWEKLDGDKNYIGMIENMRESVNLKHNASVDRDKYLTDDKNVPKQDVITNKDKEHPDEISQFALDKVSIYVAAKQTLAKRPWYRFLLHPIDSYRESKALNNLKNEITSGMYATKCLIPLMNLQILTYLIVMVIETYGILLMKKAKYKQN